jgi:hypothetical protein
VVVLAILLPNSGAWGGGAPHTTKTAARTALLKAMAVNGVAFGHHALSHHPTAVPGTPPPPGPPARGQPSTANHPHQLHASFSHIYCQVKPPSTMPKAASKRDRPYDPT